MLCADTIVEARVGALRTGLCWVHKHLECHLVCDLRMLRAGIHVYNVHSPNAHQAAEGTGSSTGSSCFAEAYTSISKLFHLFRVFYVYVCRHKKYVWRLEGNMQAWSIHTTQHGPNRNPVFTTPYHALPMDLS